MPECGTPLWPCAMTGAAACLAGFEGMHVIIHGSSGCYYYPATVLDAPLHGTFIMENEVVFGAEERLREAVTDLSGRGGKIAVVTTCVPAILGEDIKSMPGLSDIILVDSPGFAGELEAGYRAALDALQPAVDPGRTGVNIDGVCIADPFYRGNLAEIRRMLARAGIRPATVFSRDWFEMAGHAAPFTLGTNDDFSSGVGDRIGGTLGIPALRETFERLGDTFGSADTAPVLDELDLEEERVIQACDRYLRRYDPPSACIFAGSAYARFAAGSLVRYLDADILCAGTRNDPDGEPEGRFRMEKMQFMEGIQERIASCDPDLVIGSSYERSVSSGRAFVGIIPPLQDRVQLAHVPLAGTNGLLFFIENVLNACMDRH
ncbi:MAG: nitrogenase component 1 [Methanoregula sp.]